MDNIGKAISQTDDSSKAFQKRCLGEKAGLGIDIEGLYYSKKMDVYGRIAEPVQYQYYILEYLKCESSFTNSKPFRYPDSAPKDLVLKDRCPNYFSPWNSDPNKYKMNWRKFYVLYKLHLKLRPSELVLLNYSDGYIQPQNKQGEKPPRIKAPEGYDDQIRLIYVKSIDINVLNKISHYSQEELRASKEVYLEIKEDAFYTFAEYKQWFLKLNNNCILPPLFEVQTLFGDQNFSWRL